MAPKRNGYFFFLVELRKKMDAKSADAEAAILWPKMSLAQREPYNAMARKQLRSAEKLTTTLESCEQVQKRMEEEKMREDNMKVNIMGYIRCLRDSNSIENEYFQIMHINNFFATTEGINYPAELALVRFNLQRGVEPHNVYEVMVKPGPFPLGYAGMAKKQSESTHKIPYLAPGPCNTKEVTADIFEFLRETAKLGSTPSVLPPIYVKDDFLTIVRDVMNMWADAYGYDPDELCVYSLSYLMFTLRNNLQTGMVVWGAVSHSRNELDRDVYAYTPEIPCDFHQNADSPVYCSRSHVIRMAYIVCDNVCSGLGIDLIPGSHVPLDAVTRTSPIQTGAAAAAGGSGWGDESSGILNSSNASSVTNSYRTNLDDSIFDDVSTISNDYSNTDMCYQQLTSSSGERTLIPLPASGRSPLTDWRKTTFGKGRGRGIASKKSSSSN